MPGNIPNLSQLDATGGQSASTSGLPRGIYTYHNASAFQQMPKEEIKNEPGDSPSHNPSNQYQLQPMQPMFTAQSTSPGPDRSRLHSRPPRASVVPSRRLTLAM
ncbi:uncharacterized protein LOC121597905 [Anopheles merus]|uniref:uncharacterized protein LOC121597905 n=1 Tax=Anopheles merus TaxID=30066 RepID=UPI001BE3FAC8|nr:uncharacterized protein LOC121597905 [Anopheles merus]